MAETYTNSDKTILASDHPTITRGEVIASGQTLVKGSVLGKITASGKFVLCDSAATDGSQTPVAILPYDLTTTADTEVEVLVAGHFRGEKLTYAGAHDADSVRDGLRALGIYIS